ncbi:MAG TPA: hypothetical protein DCY57_12680 [Bacteroidetes bacterium]|nr:hypothetical protein [Bacteroidota bacterium]
MRCGIVPDWRAKMLPKEHLGCFKAAVLKRFDGKDKSMCIPTENQAILLMILSILQRFICRLSCSLGTVHLRFATTTYDYQF